MDSQYLVEGGCGREFNFKLGFPADPQLKVYGFLFYLL